MARRKSDTPQKAAMREMMQGYLRDNDISIKSGTDVNSIMRDMMSVLLEGVLSTRNLTKNYNAVLRDLFIFLIFYNIFS